MVAPVAALRVRFGVVPVVAQLYVPVPPEAVQVVEYADPTSFGEVAGLHVKVGSAAIVPVKACVAATPTLSTKRTV